MLPQIKWAPAILQEYVEADADVQAVVVGNKVFAAEITSAMKMGAALLR